MGTPMVSVLVVTYGSGEEIEACLDAALAQEVPDRALEVIVVDNASTDDSVERVRRYGDRVTLIESKENTGFAGGMNTAFEAAKGDILLLLNPDCTMDPGCVAALVRHLTETGGVGVAAAMLRFPDGRPQLFARRRLSLSMVLWGMTEVGKRADTRWRGGRGMADRQYADVFADPPEEAFEVDCPAAACVAVWRDPLRGKLFEPGLPIVFNDAELYRRLRIRGYRCEVVPQATAAHGRGTALARVPKPRMRAEFVASLRRYAVGEFGLTRRALVWLILATDAVGSVALAKAGDPNKRARALAQAKGTLGGLGAPMGEAPWLTKVQPMRPRPRTMLRMVRGVAPSSARSTGRSFRRQVFLARLRLSAWLMRSTIDAEIDPTADIGLDVGLEIRPRTRLKLHIGEGARVQSGVLLRLDGPLHIGPYCQIRTGVAVNVHGDLRFEGRNIICRGSAVHCDGNQVWEWGASTSENVTVVDSDHVVDGSILHLWEHPVVVSDVRIEASAFIAAHAVVTRGVTIGRAAVVGANAVVTQDVPAGCLAVGSPARVVKKLG